MERTLKQVSFEELLGMFEPKVHQQIRDMVKRFSSTHVVVFENEDLTSSHLGERSALGIGGPENTLKDLEEASRQRLGDTPSVFKYPTVYAEVDDESGR